MQQNIEEYTKFNFETKIQVGINQINDIKIIRPVFDTVDRNQINCSLVEDRFTFFLGKNRFRTNSESCIIICSKDNGKILSHTLEILKKYDINKTYDILLVDDRSSSSDILELSERYETSYLKISNNNDIFNYSAINNIAVMYAKSFDKKTILFYNNDLWPSSEDTIDNLVKKYNNYKSDILGCKLVYPTEQAYNEIDKPIHVLGPNMARVFDTIQHGGIHFILKQSVFSDSKRTYYGEDVVLAPSHLWRFYEKNTNMASVDSKCFAVTGAIQIIATEVFVQLNGFNNGLCAAFQDIDICLRGVEIGLNVNYVGSEYMYHAESLTQAKEKDSYVGRINCDNILWDILWGRKLPKLLGYQAHG